MYKYTKIYGTVNSYKKIYYTQYMYKHKKSFGTVKCYNKNIHNNCTNI